MIEHRKTYIPTDAMWEEAVLAAIAAEEVEVWWKGGHGARGMVTPEDVHNTWLNGRYFTRGGRPASELTSVKILQFPKPGWHGARVIQSRDSNNFRLKHGPQSYIGHSGTVSQQNELYDDYAVIVDADNHIPVASLLELNGVSREKLTNVVLEELQDMTVTYSTLTRVIDAVLHALEGKS